MTTLETTDAPTRALVGIDSLDHLVLTVRDIDATIRFYTGILGMREATFGNGRRALLFGDQKINLHEVGAEVKPNAASAAPGSADLCLLTSMPVEGTLRVFEAHGIGVEQGPVERAGATGRLLSVYVRDPDGNLVELANRLGS